MQARLHENAREHVWTPSALCAALEDAFARSWPAFVVAGEVSNYTLAGSGHSYFTLKDAQAQVRCVLFRRAGANLGFALQNGLQVQVRARLSIFAGRGDLQLVVEGVSLPSRGDLHERFLQLKAKLEAEGLFASARKRALPDFVHTIGLVTSPDGAALHDVAQALARRAPQVRVLFAPSSVQGAQAPAQLQQALRVLYTQPVQVILLVRGGGAAEDLAAFNDEALARLLAQSPVPVVSGVGHETDVCIADWVADVRAATPTAAAELVAPERMQLLRVLAEQDAALHAALRYRLAQAAQKLDTAEQQLAHARRYALVQQYARLESQARQLRHSLQQRLTGAAHLLQQLQWRWQHARTRAVEQQRMRLLRLEQGLLAAQNAHWQRQQQVATVLTSAGAALHSTQQVQVGEMVYAQLTDGRLRLQVQEIEPAAQK